MQAQDSNDPTGVVVVAGKHSKELTRARKRKANAALALSLAGADWKQISRSCGYPTPRAAKVAVELMLEKRLDAMDRDHLRLQVSGRLDSLLRSVWNKAHDQDSPDHLPAVGRARDIIADHRKVWGLDAPTEVMVTSPTQGQLDEWVARVLSTTMPTVEEFDIVDGEVLEDEDPGDAVSTG